MRLPKSVTINGKRWTVVRKRLAHRGLEGQCIHRTREIQIESRLPDAEVGEVFLHELMHACLPEFWSRTLEEKLVLRLAPRLLHTLENIGWVK